MLLAWLWAAVVGLQLCQADQRATVSYKITTRPETRTALISKLESINAQEISGQLKSNEGCSSPTDYCNVVTGAEVQLAITAGPGSVLAGPGSGRTPMPPSNEASKDHLSQVAHPAGTPHLQPVTAQLTQASFTTNGQGKGAFSADSTDVGRTYYTFTVYPPPARRVGTLVNQTFQTVTIDWWDVNMLPSELDHRDVAVITILPHVTSPDSVVVPDCHTICNMHVAA